MPRMTYLVSLIAVLLSLSETIRASPGSRPIHSYGTELPDAKYRYLPSLREQASLQDSWTAQRVSGVPNLLQKYGVDAWLISQREHTEDTVFWSMKSARQFSARRRTTTLFLAANVTDGDGAQAIPYNWIDNTPQVWHELRDVLERHDPRTIVVNVDADIAFSGGMHSGELYTIVKELGQKWKERLVAKRMLAVEYVATMLIPEQMEWYRKLQETAWAMISEAFSERVITPGETTADDVVWWLREKIVQMNYTTWFHPAINIVRPDTTIGGIQMASSDTMQDRDTIQYGDMLHTDFGVTALGLNTDTQHLAYVLHPGETEADIPQGFIDGLAKVNRLQDIAREHMIVGMTGNDILNASLAQMRDEGIEGKIYSHPIGDWGHSAGTLIGMTNLQSIVPSLGDLPLLNNTFYSVELYADHFVPERNATYSFFQEEDVFWVGDGKAAGGSDWEWVFGRQERFHVIRTPGSKEGHGEPEKQSGDSREKKEGIVIQEEL